MHLRIHARRPIYGLGLVCVLAACFDGNRARPQASRQAGFDSKKFSSLYPFYEKYERRRSFTLFSNNIHFGLPKGLDSFYSLAVLRTHFPLSLFSSMQYLGHTDLPLITEEICDGIDNDQEGTIDDDESCWVSVYRFWKLELPLGTRPRCYSDSKAVPAECAGYTLEFAGPVFHLHSRPIEGSVGLIALDKEDDHLLVRADATEEFRDLILSEGYAARAVLGYIWASRDRPPVGKYYKPQKGKLPTIRDLRRYLRSPSTKNRAPTTMHLYANNPEETAPKYVFQGIQGFVWSSRW